MTYRSTLNGSSLLAFLIVVDGFSDMAVCAATGPKARYIAWKAAQEAGYNSVTFSRIRSIRCPQLDAWAAKQERPRLTARDQAEWDAR